MASSTWEWHADLIAPKRRSGAVPREQVRPATGWRGINPRVNPEADALEAPKADTWHMTIPDYALNIALISLVVLQIRGHRITRARLLFPVLMTVWACSQFLHAVPAAGNDLALVTALALLGGTLGVLAGATTSLSRRDDGAFAKAGPIAAFLWVLGIGARMAFAIWVTHGGQGSVAHFSAAAHITSGTAWTAAFVLMALTEVLSRTGVLYLKTRRLGAVIPRGGFRHSPAAA
jgi:hypothetical protein